MQKKENFFLDNPDIGFHFDHKIEWETLFELALPEDLEALGVASKDEYKKTFKDLLEQAGEVIGTTLASNQQDVAKQDLVLQGGEVLFPPAITENIKAMNDLGIQAMGIASRFGGLANPICVELPAVEMLYRACPSTCLNVTWYAPVARVIDEFGSDSQKERVIPRIASGEWSGNMALTEPDAGSDLGAIRTYAEKQSDGSWRMYGSKRFISNGIGQVSLVLAKNSKGAQGLHNLNLYLCLRKNEDGTQNYQVTKLEEKPGLHGSPTCEIKYDESYAELIGQDGHGFQYMLHMMNEFRVGVAFQGVAVMEAVLRLAHEYTSQRHAWGRPIAQHELLAERLLDMEVSLKATRSLCAQASNALSIYQMACRKLRDDKTLSSEHKEKLKDISKRYERRLRRWTPLIKFYAAEQAVHNARQCLQMHGGYGFTCEYKTEWWLRESLILPVYEGTSQIQALMCLKDTMKEIIRRPRSFMESALGSKLARLTKRDPLQRKLAYLKKEFNGGMVSIIIQLIKTNMRDSMADINPLDLRKMIKAIGNDLVKFENLRPALLQAERITEMKAAICMAESLIADARIDSTRTWLAERWLNKSTPRVQMLRAEIESQEPVLAHRMSEIPTLNMATKM
jgi:alkylation response protein AidB-like acyl-CoA dehydrogenase